jgi:Mg-chelatase subunit ChlD
MDFFSHWREYQLGFDSPRVLWLLPALLIPLWLISFRSLAGLGGWRRLMALGFRTAILTALVLALADVQLQRATEKVTVIYVVDQSQSIPAPRRTALLDYVNRAIKDHRDRDDRAGVIVFARDATIEAPPFDSDIRVSTTPETELDPQFTNLQAAIKLAQASFPGDSARRIVVVTDGNQNMGDALEQARGAAESGVGIDVVPVSLPKQSDVLIERIVTPADVRKGQPFDLRVVVNHAADDGAPPARGKLVVRQQADDVSSVLSEQQVTLTPGKHVFTIRQEIETPAFYSYEAQFVPDGAADDAIAENNRVAAFSYVRGSGQVLLIEDFENPGEHELLADRLRKQNIEVTKRASDQAFRSLQELQQFDSVILANVPREHFSDEQIAMLASNTQHLGAGLIMLGGPNSFGAGGWAETPIETAMPLEFHVKAAKVVPAGALAIVLDKSGSMQGEKMTMAASAACAAIDGLSERDHVGVFAFDSVASTVVRMQPRRDSRPMKARVIRIAADGGTNMGPGLQLAHQALRQAPDVGVRHIILLTDGRSEGAGYPRMIRQMADDRITITTVAVGGDADVPLLRQLAQSGGGKFYHALNPKALPKIFQTEARRVARPMIYEKDTGIQPNLVYPHELLGGIDAFPPITGYVLTTVKKNPLVEVALNSPQPAGKDNTTLLATWNYGLGKAICFTSDAGARWTHPWVEWANYDKFFSQMVRWSMRPVEDAGKFTLATELDDGVTRVVITALDKDENFLNFLSMESTVLGPDLKPRSLELKQVAPGRYVGEFPSDDSGNYFLTVVPNPGAAPIRSGVSVPYSREFRDRDANLPLLEQIASLAPPRGRPGVLIQDATGNDRMEELLKISSFRHDLPPARSNQDVWQFLVWGTCLAFFGDVFIRRVTLSWDWVAPVADRVGVMFGRTKAPERDATIERLRSRKVAATDEMDRRRAAMRFEPAPDAPIASTATLESAATAEAPKRAPTPVETTLEPTALETGNSYTDRLLRAKKEAKKFREN